MSCGRVAVLHRTCATTRRCLWRAQCQFRLLGFGKSVRLRFGRAILGKVQRKGRGRTTEVVVTYFALHNTNSSTHIARSIAEFDPAAHGAFGARPLERRGAGPREQRVTLGSYAYCIASTSSSHYPLRPVRCTTRGYHPRWISSNVRPPTLSQIPCKANLPECRTRQAGVPDLDVRHQVVLQSSQECSAQCQRDGGKSQGGNE
jgi:hypothetical protein